MTDRHVTVNPTPYGDLLTFGPMSRAGWSALAQWIIETQLGPRADDYARTREAAERLRD